MTDVDDEKPEREWCCSPLKIGRQDVLVECQIPEVTAKARPSVTRGAAFKRDEYVIEVFNNVANAVCHCPADDLKPGGVSVYTSSSLEAKIAFPVASNRRGRRFG